MVGRGSRTFARIRRAILRILDYRTQGLISAEPGPARTISIRSL
jgi:hypothetical protein